MGDPNVIAMKTCLLVHLLGYCGMWGLCKRSVCFHAGASQRRCRQDKEKRKGVKRECGFDSFSGKLGQRLERATIK